MVLILAVPPTMLVSAFFTHPGFSEHVLTCSLAWEFVEINAGQGVPGFELENSSTIVWNNTEFGGWLGKYLHCLYISVD